MKLANLIFLFFIANITFGQNVYDIKRPQKDYIKKCGKCMEVLNTMPPEVQFGLQSDEFGNIYFLITNKTWFDKLFKKKYDGISVDIVLKEQYTCGKKNNIRTSWASKGTLIPPMYLKDLKKNMLITEYGAVIVKVGEIPKELIDKELELNILLLKNKYLCHYSYFFNIKSYRWSLLDMGLYMDTITYLTERDTSVSLKEKVVYHNKTLKFVIPFEKNKSEFSTKDIQPLYDSLRLTDFNISNIDIRAYSSVEGSEKRNIELQEKRAKSIIDALQSFQIPKIKQKVSASENWVEFYKDISSSSFEYLTKMTKNQIKEKLKNKNLLLKIEPYLKNHRKAVLFINLEKKNTVVLSTSKQILDAFEKSIKEKNIAEAIEIQKNIFSKILDNKLPSSFINTINIPEKTEYSLLLNNQVAIKYMTDETDLYSTYLAYKHLQDLFPKDGHIQYNICALKFRLWILGKELVDPKKFKIEIKNLTYKSISPVLVKRMLVNYNIVMSELYMRNGDYKNKDKSLRFIKTKYKYIQTTDKDLLSIAQLFVSYAKYDWAIKLLEPKVKNIDVDEDLLFYYLNLTISDSKLIKKTSYRTIMLNAVNMNKGRFCKMFSSFSSGGISFQLLQKKYIKQTYCESCN